MRRVGIVRSAASVVVCMVAVASCGGGGSSSATTTTSAPSITKADYIAQANALCQTMNDDVKAVPAPGSDPIKTADSLDQVVEIVTNTLAKLRALPTPAGDGTVLLAIFTKVELLLTDYRNLSAELRAGNLPAATQLDATSKTDQKAANDASNAYGLTVCGS